MLEKLLSTLPYNPNTPKQLAFYAGRLHDEKSVRRIGLIFILLTFFVQFFAFISPPQSTMARSNNDIVDGGFRSLSEALNYCKNDTANFQDILKHYGISCADLSKSTTVSLKSTDHNKQLYSMGRLPYGKAGETPVTIGGNTYYLRYLWSWDGTYTSTYKALKGTSSVTGKTFYILYDCGNLTFVGLPVVPARCIWNSSIFQTDNRCSAPVCPLDKSLSASSPICKSCPYNSRILKSNPASVQCPYPGLGNITKDDSRCLAPCPYNSSVSDSDVTCKPCTASQTKDDKTACLTLSKVASNITTKVQDANGTVAQPGDVISYTLVVKNIGKATVNDYVVQENMSDVLDYADITDLHGSNQNDQNIVSWPALDIMPGQTIKKQITVKVKANLSNTPTSSSDPGHYDSIMTNVYGNAVNISVPQTAVKSAEQTVSTLPNTGPGTGLTITALVTVLAGFFFARARLLNKEANLALAQYQSDSRG
jgi:uncharacterized repeat protein (TIGR01451 family)